MKKEKDNLSETAKLRKNSNICEYQLKNILQTMIDGMVTVNTWGEIIYANPSAEKILEIHEDKILGRYFNEREWKQIDLNGNPYPLKQLPLAIALTEQRTVSNLIHGIIAPNGQIKWLSVNAAPLKNDNGELIGAIGSFRDITENRESRQALIESEEFLNETGKIAKIGGWSYDIINNKVNWTKEVYRIHEVDSNFVPTLETGIAFYDKSSEQAIRLAIDEAINKAKPFDLELKIITAENHIKEVRSIGKPVKNKDDKTIAVRGSFQDITERYEIEQALKARVDELNCISELSKLVETKTNTDEIFSGLTTILKKSFRFPQITEVQIITPDVTHQTAKFKETEWTMHSDIIVDGKNKGKICVAYLENSTINKDPFLKEEYFLLDIISKRLGEIIERLEKSKNYAELFETLSEGVIKTDKNGIIVEANPEAVRICGYDSLTELIGRPMTELYSDPLLRNEVIKEIKQNNGKLYNLEFLLKRKDYSTVFTLCNIQILINQKGEFNGTLGAFRDISERKKAEEALKNREVLLKNTGALAKVGGWEIDMEGNTLIWTDETFHIHEMEIGYPPDVAGAISFYHPDDRDMVSSHVEKSLSRGTPFDFEARLITRKNNLIWVHASGKPVFKKKKLTGVIGSIQDITEKKEQEKEKQQLLEQLNHKSKMDAIGQISSGVAHDFNNILTGIIGSVSLLESCEKNLSEKGHRLIDIIMKSSERATLLTNKLLLFSRKKGLNKQICLLQPIIEDTVKMMESTLDKKIAIQSVKNEKDLYVFADPSSLQNTLMNLCINAGQAIHGEGEISISTERVFLDEAYCRNSLFEIKPGNYVRIKIVDNGSGIPEEHLNKIFDPFFTTKETGKGTGLGLSAVYGIIKDHSGEIKVESTVGRGSVFDIFLPESEKRKKKSANQDSHEPVMRPGKGTVLLVDDEKFNRTVGQELLESLGYHVLTASDGAEACAVYKEKKKEIDIVLLDYMMPKMNGKETFQKIRDLNKDCKVILMTGYAENEDIIEMRAMGLKGELHKPYRVSALAMVLNQVFL